MAARYYQAALAQLLPGSDLGIVLAVNALACDGSFDAPLSVNSDNSGIDTVVHQALASSSATISAIGSFLSSLIAYGVQAK